MEAAGEGDGLGDRGEGLIVFEGQDGEACLFPDHEILPELRLFTPECWVWGIGEAGSAAANGAADGNGSA